MRQLDPDEIQVFLREGALQQDLRQHRLGVDVEPLPDQHAARGDQQHRDRNRDPDAREPQRRAGEHERGCEGGSHRTTEDR